MKAWFEFRSRLLSSTSTLGSIVAIFLSFALGAANGVAQAPLAKSVDDIFTKYLDAGLAGSVLVAEGGRITLRKAYGYQNNENKTANRPETLFNVASIGKQFTAYSVLLLEKRGLLSTNDYVSKYLPEFAQSKATIHHLLTHSSGLFIQNVTLDYTTRENFIKSVLKAGPESPPGEKYRYSNAGYSLLAAIVEVRTKKSFEKFVFENIFSPLRMDRTGYPWEARLKAYPMATGYNKKREPVPPQVDVWAARGPGNIVTNVDDLYKWMQAFQSGNRISKGIREKMLFDHMPGNESYAWNKAKSGHGTRFFHKGGGRSDFESRLMWFPDDKVLVIFMLNNDFDLAGKIFNDVAAIIH